MSGTTIKSAQRVLEVLEAFDRERQPLALKEICAALDYPASSAAGLLKSLVTLGYLDYDRATRTYFPTMRIALLGQWVPRALFGEGAILRLMENLHRETGETVLLATESDLHAQYVHAVNTGEPLRAAVPAGTLRPLATSGTGWLLLSRRTKTEIERLCRRIDIETGRKVDRAALRRNIAQARRDGFVFSKHNVSRGTGIIAMLLPGGAFGRTYAIGVGGSVTRLEKNQEAILKALRRGVTRFAQAE
jgi:DNA-binding IclR family transcriptional regulator